MEGMLGVMAPTMSVGATVTVFPREHCDAGVKAESVALYE